MSSNIRLQWTAGPPSERFRTAVSLHSHTLYSRESLNFIDHAAARIPLLAAVVRHGKARHRAIQGTELDLSRGWWTPPLGPRDAWVVEKTQIEDLDLFPLVSLTDHDDIEAPLSLQVLNECRDCPVSVEWTVPFGPTFFHLGVHNLPLSTARAFFAGMDAYTRNPIETNLREILTGLAAVRDVLVVFNHPLWDEVGLGPAKHRDRLDVFLRLHGESVHALEINGLRPWRENREIIDLARRFRKPVISGGDRHALEPNAVLNLTNAASFSEFVDEVRAGWSDILILQHYRETHALRILHNMVDVLRTHDAHANGWRLWSDRVFYHCADGNVRSLTQLFCAGTPAPIALFVNTLSLVSAPHMRRLLNGALFPREEIVL